jgi:D-3-phosphoglycerate dehydrogenase
VLSEADYVVLQAPATPATRGMIGTAALAAMKPTSYLVNVGRGALVDTGALVDALRSGGIAGAALDVFPEEPLGADSPLRGLDNVLLTPHTAFYSEESMVDLQEQAARNVIAVLQGGAPNTPVNPEVASRLRHP